MHTQSMASLHEISQASSCHQTRHVFVNLMSSNERMKWAEDTALQIKFLVTKYNLLLLVLYLINAS